MERAGSGGASIRPAEEMDPDTGQQAAVSPPADDVSDAAAAMAAGLGGKMDFSGELCVLAKEQPGGEVILTLQYPFNHDGKMLSRLTIRRPKLKQKQELNRLWNRSGADVDSIVHLLGQLTDEIDPAMADAGDVDDMDGADAFRFWSVVQLFFPKYQTAPSKSK